MRLIQWTVLVGWMLGSWAQAELALPDTIVFKPDATLPSYVKSREYRCAIVDETATAVKIDRSSVRGITDYVEISKELIAEIRRADPGERRFQEIKGTIVFPENSEAPEFYQKIIDESLDVFASKFPTSKYIDEVSQLSKKYREELEKIRSGYVRRGEVWYGPTEWKDLQKVFEPMDIVSHLEKAAKTNDYRTLGDEAKKIPKDHPSQFFPEVVQKSIPILEAALRTMDPQVYLTRIQEDLKELEGRRLTYDVQVKGDVDDVTRKELIAKMKAIDVERRKLQDESTQVQRTFTDLKKVIETELDRLKKTPIDPKLESIRVLAQAEKLRHDPASAEALRQELTKASKLWPAGSHVWRMALDEASFYIDQAGLAFKAGQLPAVETNLKTAQALLGVGGLPPGVDGIKKTVPELIKASNVAAPVETIITGRQWDKFDEKVAAYEKVIGLPKPLDYPVIHRFHEAASAWKMGALARKKEAMDKSTSEVELFYSTVKSDGFEKASSHLIQAKELWPGNPKVTSAYLEFKQAISAIEVEKRVKEIAPLVESIEKTITERKFKDAEAALKKLAATFAEHPKLGELNGKLKAEKARVLEEEKKKLEEAERLRLQAEHEEQMKQYMIYGGVGLVLLLVGGGGFLFWRKKQKAQEEAEFPQA